MRIILTVMSLAALSAQGASAQIVEKETEKNVSHIAAVGDIVWEKANFAGAPGVTISSAIQERFVMNQMVSLAAGSTLTTIRQKKLKACHERVTYYLGGMASGGWQGCLIDKDDDGRFELVALNEVSGAHPVNPPVPYKQGIVPINGTGEKSFRRTLTYLGKSGSDLRLSYREFGNDMARPAFTEDLTIPAPSEYPQAVRVKDILLQVTGIDGEGLHYILK